MFIISSEKLVPHMLGDEDDGSGGEERPRRSV